MRTPEEKARQQGISGKQPGMLDHLITPDLAKAQQEGYNDHLRNRDLAEQMTRARDRDRAPEIDYDTSYRGPSTPRKPADPDAQIKKIFYYSLSFISLAVAYGLLTVSNAFSFVWWLGVVAVVLGIPAILILAGVAVYAALAALACLVAFAIINIIIEIIKYFIAHPM